MKKIILYIVFFIFLCFLLPIIFTKRDVNKDVKEDGNKGDYLDSVSTYDYKKYKTIKLLHTEQDNVEEISLDDYLYGVVCAEMPASYDIEALKAQAVAARTYTIYKIINNNGKHDKADICDDPTCCQAWISKKDRFDKWEDDKEDEYWNKIKACVNNTQGEIITYDNKPINAFFHANSGGITEVTSDVWGGEDYPYLKSVETSGEDAYSQYHSEVILSRQTFIDKIKQLHSDFRIDFNNKDDITILEYTESNRVKKVKLGNLELSGVELRSILGLKSANFKISLSGENIKFEVIGYGHGVGMSQTGADSMAKKRI